MDTVTLATSAEDAAAVEAVRRHHAELAGALSLRVAELVRAAVAGDAEEARSDLVDWSRTELVPHALAEEKAMYPAGMGLRDTRSLVEAMLAEHVVITDLVDRLAAEREPVAVATHAGALQVLFETHLAKENDQLLPALAAAPGVSVVELLGGMHELLGGDHAAEGALPDDGHSCGCGEQDPAGYPELDARAVPHAIRHATIFGALDAVRPGAGLVLVAPHDPLPRLDPDEQRRPRAVRAWCWSRRTTRCRCSPRSSSASRGRSRSATSSAVRRRGGCSSCAAPREGAQLQRSRAGTKSRPRSPV